MKLPKVERFLTNFVLKAAGPFDARLYCKLSPLDSAWRGISYS
jgi:hypothetical protein